MGVLYDYSMPGFMQFTASTSSNILIGVCSLMFLIAALDYLYQRYEYLKSLKMSKRDIKDEFKSTEGSPEIRAKLREIRRERASKRMMAAVPNADVVITNPTHFSVALQYDESKTAPLVLAKGQDETALRIREVAKEHDIPIVQNPPLARALYQYVEIDEEIPVEHYKAVAEIIRYVYELKGKL